MFVNFEHFIERALIMYAGTGEIQFDAKQASHRTETGLIGTALDAEWDLDRLEREYILATLEKTGGHRTRAARILGVDRRTLYRKRSGHGLNRNRPAGTRIRMP
jgi:DNA-binding NtrC family response regulator